LSSNITQNDNPKHLEASKRGKRLEVIVGGKECVESNMVDYNNYSSLLDRTTIIKINYLIVLNSPLTRYMKDYEIRVLFKKKNQIENIINKNKQIQKVGDIGPDPGLTETEIQRDKTVQVVQL